MIDEEYRLESIEGYPDVIGISFLMKILLKTNILVYS